MAKNGILIIQSMGLGDLVFALPAVKALKRAYPDEPLTFLTHQNHELLLNLVPEIDSVIVYKEKHPAAIFSIVRRIRSHHFKKAFILNPILRGSLLAWLSGIPERIGYLRDYERQQSMHGFGNILLTHFYFPKEEKRHEVDRYLDLLESHGIKVLPEHREPSLAVPEALRSQNPLPQTIPGKPAVIINLGAGWVNRLWPENRIIELSQKLINAYDAQIYLCGGRAESSLAGNILKELNGRGVSLCSGVSLPALAAYLRQCSLFITSDTGPLHIASALKVPTLALFGPGDLLKVQPRSEKTHVLYHAMPCSPCRVQYTELCGQNLCMQEISVKEVFEGAGKILGNPKTVSFDQTSKVLEAKKRILYLQSTSEVGGTDVTLLRTLDALDKNNYEPHIILPKEGPFTEAYKKLGCRLHIVPSMRKLTSRRGLGYLFQFLTGYLPAVLKIRRIIRENRIDLVHTNTIHNLYGFLAAKLAGVPHVWHIREIVVQSPWMKKIEVFLVKYFSTRFIVMDNAISEMFLGERQGYPKNIVKLYDGVDLQKFHPSVSGARIRKDLNLTPHIPVLGTVGRLDPWKGLDLLIDAFQLIYRKHPEAHLFICGGEIEGHEGYEAKLRQKISAFGLQKNVHITGWKYFGSDIPEVYGALDISVQCPAYPEPYGLANVEAMASGVPTVAVKEGGPSELCEDGKTGFLVSKDAQSIARAVNALLEAPEKGKAMGEAGRKRAETLFDHQKCTRNLEALYADILGTQKRGNS